MVEYVSFKDRLRDGSAKLTAFFGNVRDSSMVSVAAHIDRIMESTIRTVTVATLGKKDIPAGRADNLT